MSALARKRYRYVAHIQKRDGTVAELAGSVADWSAQHVYNRLRRRSDQMDGYIMRQKIVPDDDNETYDVLSLPFVPDEEPDSNDTDTAEVLGAEEYFGEWKSAYKPASLCVFKETG